jgi:threonine/homoserine/homoserine lactone efflux protein
MTLQSYLFFMGACLLLLISPGPDMMYLLGRCVAQGRRAGIIAALGINAGAYVHLAAAITGLSAILMTSALAFTLVKWAGAAYLIYLGCRTLFEKQKEQVPSTALRGQGGRAIFWQGFLSDVLNPKVAIFYLAFLPQFIPVEDERPVASLLLLGLTANILGLLFNVGLAMASARMMLALRHNARPTVWLQKTMGTVMIGLGVKLAAEKI